MAIAQKTLWDDVKELVLEQYKSSPNLKGLIQSVVDECAQPIEDAAFSIQDFFEISKASGGWLDILGKYVSLKRKPGESDGSFRERIVIEASKNTAGTPDNVIYAAKMISGDDHPQYMDEAPATFFVYTPGGRQLKRATVKKMAPCGVLGLPGAAIQFADGSLMGDAQGKKVLMVADDDRIETDTVLADDSYTPILDNYGTPLRAVVKGTDSAQTVNVEHGGVSYNAIRIKDLPDDDGTGGYMVRDSSARGTVKTDSMSVEELETLWNNTEPEGA